MKLKTTIFFLLGVCSLIPAMAASEKIDSKFFKEAANSVWSMNLPVFNPNTPIPDSIAEGKGAVIIAQYNNIDANRIESSQMGNFVDIDRRYIGETTINQIRRCMVKLLNSNAVEHYSTFTFDPKETNSIGNGLVVSEHNEAFGARIHKPGGLTVDIDISETLTETSGKKNNKSEVHKIAIPGLEVGDVLEYFYYTRKYIFGDQGVATKINILSRYPIMNYILVGSFDGTLTTEINTFNGLNANIFKNESTSERNILSATFKNLGSIDELNWCNTARQVPFIRLSINDNLSRIFGSPESARRSGLYFNLPAPLIMTEVAEKFSKTSIPGADESIVSDILKEYRKANPNATDAQIADAAWIAIKYIATVSKEIYDWWRLTCLMKDILDKNKLSTPAYLAVTTEHFDIPIDKITSYTQARPLVIVGDKFYAGDAITQIMPGELPDIYHGENAFYFTGKRTDIFKNMQLDHANELRLATLPDHSYRENTTTCNIDIMIPDPEATKLDFNYKLSAKGASKNLHVIPMASEDIVSQAENFFNIPDKKRTKRDFKQNASMFNEMMKKLFDAKPEMDLGLDNATVDTVIVTANSFLPESNKMEYTVSGHIDNLISSAGSDLIVKIGAFSGAMAQSSNDKLPKVRDIDICTSSAVQNRYNLTLHIPEGYRVDPNSLESIKINKTNQTGMFYAQANYEPEQNIVKITFMNINAHRNHPASAWNDFLDLRQTANDFSDTIIVLHPEQ